MLDVRKTPDTSFVPVDKADIAAFAEKFAQWGATLPSKEQALVQVLVDRARGLIPDDVRQHQLRVELSMALQVVYASCAHAWGDAKDPPTWVRVDPIWYKAGPTESGEQLDLTVRLTADNGPPDPVTLPPATSIAGPSAASALRSPAPGSPAAASPAPAVAPATGPGEAEPPPTKPPAAGAKG